ncbi:putative UBX domain containing protein [Leishmania utingensis]|uniref:UBX domain containing protein n=1 Tax=Leishmania utingensis TaxID=653362 RepID=A0AAW2ZY08_9TRYP
MLVHEVEKRYKLKVPFFQGTLEEAKRHAQHDSRYLVLYLHSPQHENTEAYLREVLATDEIIALLHESSVLFGASVADAEGTLLAEELGAHAFPFVAALVGNTVVLRLQGYHSRETFCREWRLCTDDWDGHLAEGVVLAAEREAREQARIAEAEAASAMEAADRAMLEKLLRKEEEERRAAAEREAAAQRAAEERVAAERLEAEDRARQAAEEARQRALEEERQRQRESAKQAAKSQLHDEPSTDLATHETVQISVRCPSGKHYDRRFLRSDLVDQLTFFVMTLDELADATDASTVRFVTGFPPAPLEWREGETCFGDMKSLCPRAVVLLRRS